MRLYKRIACIGFVSALVLIGVVGLSPVFAAAQELQREGSSQSSSLVHEAALSGGTTPANAPDERTQGYREREAQNPQSASFRGGDGAGIYIGGSAGLLIVVLLVILLLR